MRPLCLERVSTLAIGRAGARPIGVSGGPSDLGRANSVGQQARSKQTPVVPATAEPTEPTEPTELTELTELPDPSHQLPSTQFP